MSDFRLSRIAVYANWVAATLCFFPPAAAWGGSRQLPLAPIELLPNVPSTYEMRDWRATAENFDTLAFDTSATGQYLPLVRIDNTPVSPQLTTAFGLAAYVGDNRVNHTGELVTEGIPSLAAVLGGSLVGIDKTTGPYNWVAMTREYYVNRNGEYVVLNSPYASSGVTAWYEVFPNILFYSIADRYPQQASLQTISNTIDVRFYDAVNVLTAGGTSPNFNYTAYDFQARQGVYNGTWREPDMGLGMAWMQHAAYWRNRESNPTQAASHLQAVGWALEYYEGLSTNPTYEILTPFGAYAAARMNAEHGGNYDVTKMLGWAFSRSNARPDWIMISGEQWGGQDVAGLLGAMRPNTSNVQGYAFAMNSYATAMPVVPLARYEDRFSRAVGKWMLNMASAARLFYGDALPPEYQSSEFWTGDSEYAIGYEGIRHNWLPPNLLAPGERTDLYAAGDPLTYGWGPETDFGIYGSAFAGVLGSIIRTTNVEKILQLDLLATDSFHDTAHPTYLYYNPHASAQSVNIDLPSGQTFDLYDASANLFIARGVGGQASFSVGADDTVMLVLVPPGGTESRIGRQLLVDGVVVDYNASLLADNLVRNPDVDLAINPGANRPAFWHYSSGATWSSDTAFSPTHSLELVDDDPSKAEEWRSYATALTAGENRTLELRWFWDHDITPGDEFRARLRLSGDEAVGVDLTNPSSEQSFVVTGTSTGFAMFQTSIVLPDSARSFDLTFITGWEASALGTIHIDDISAAVVMTPTLLGDYNQDGVVDAGDYTVWRDTLGSTGSGLAADGNGDMTVDAGDYFVWKSHFGTMAPNSVIAAIPPRLVPEPAAMLTALLLLAGFGWVIAGTRRDRPSAASSDARHPIEMENRTRRPPTGLTQSFSSAHPKQSPHLCSFASVRLRVTFVALLSKGLATKKQTLAAGRMNVMDPVHRLRFSRTCHRMSVAMLAMATLASTPPCVAEVASSPPAIHRVQGMPNLPQPLKLRDWAQVTRDYLDLLLDGKRQGVHLPLMEQRGEPGSLVALASYVGGQRNTEAINYLAAVISGSLVNIDMRDYQQQDWLTPSRDFFNAEEGVYVNRPGPSTGVEFWYALLPNLLMYQLDALYPDEEGGRKQALQVAETWYKVCVALGGSNDPPRLPDFDHTGFDLRTMQPLDRGWVEPEAAAGIAWLEYLAWRRFGDERFLVAADWSLRALEARSPEQSPLYEVLLPYGALAAARMNAELNRDYDVEKLLDACFDARPSPQARPGWGVIGDRWNGIDMHGLVGSTTDGGGYAFAMNSFQWAGAVTPIARYDTRYARDIGKWMLNLSNAARQFYPNACSPKQQSSFEWSKRYDPRGAIAYEGVRKWKRGADLAVADVVTRGGRILDGSFASTHFTREQPLEQQVLETDPQIGEQFEHVWRLHLSPERGRWLVMAASAAPSDVERARFRVSYADSPQGKYRHAFDITGDTQAQVARLPDDFTGALYVKVVGPHGGEGDIRAQLLVDAIAVTHQSSRIGPFAQGDSVVTFVALLENATTPIVLYRPATVVTDLGLYGSSHVGILGGIVRPTSVEGILQLDLLKTDYYHPRSYPTYLYYNPHPTQRTVELNIGSDAKCVYDAVTDEVLEEQVEGRARFALPPDSARVIVLAPAGGTLRREGGATLIDDIVVRFPHEMAHRP